MPPLPPIHWPLGDIGSLDINDQIIGFQRNGNSRGTLEIVWPCVAAAFITVSVVWHHNVQKERKLMVSFMMRAGLAAFAAIVPEFMLAKAIWDWIKCRQWRGALNRKRRYDGKLLCCSAKLVFLVNMGGLEGNFSTGQTQRLTVRDLRDYAIRGQLDLSAVSDEEISDHSKADSLVKLIACFQSLWFFLQLIVRLTQHLPVTPLETTTSAYVFSSLSAYIMWFKKPYNVKRALSIQIHGPRSPHLPKRTESLRDVNYGYQCLVLGIVIAIVSSVILGAIHCASWTAPFPTPVEGTLWRVSSVVVTVTPLCASLFVLGWLTWDHFLKRFKFSVPLIYECCRMLPFAIPVAVFVLARLTLLFLALASMRKLPAGAYVTPSWTAIIPHI